MDFRNNQASPNRKGKSYGDTLKKGASGEPVFGRPSKPREQEPSLSELMQWQPQVVEKSDFKKMKKDLFNFEDPQFEFYRTKIQKADNQWVSEARDNYRNFKNPESLDVRHWNPYSGEYSAPFPVNGGGIGGAEINQQSLRARKGEFPNGAGNEYMASLPIGSQAQMMQQRQQQAQYGQQYSQYQQQAPYQVQIQNMNGQLQQQMLQQPVMMNSTPSMLSPSQIQYMGEMATSQPLRSAEHAQGQNPQYVEEGQPSHFKHGQADQEEIIDYEEEEVDPEQAKLDHQHMKDFLRTSRWKANSYTQKVLARPAFMNYGWKNVNPTVGGFLYGQYLHSHNVNPQRGMQPEYRQVYKNAQMFGDRVPPHTAPQIPRPPPPTINEERVTEGEMKRNPLEAEKLNPEKEKRRTMKSSSSTMRSASAGKKLNSNNANMQASIGKPQTPKNGQMQYQQQQPQYQPHTQANVQMQQSQGQLAPKITITPADLDKNRVQMNAAQKDRLMAKIEKDSGHPGNYLSPQDINTTVKLGNKGIGRGPGVPQVGFIDQMSETKKRQDTGSNYGGASSIGKYPAYDDDYLEIGSGF